MPIIELKNLRKTYFGEAFDTDVLKGINFSVEKGELVAIMGPSGSGKSTLLHILGFLDIPTSGTFNFDGKEWNEYDGNEVAQLRNKKIGFVFQSFNLLSRTTVLDNVKLPLQYSNIPESEWDELARTAVESVGLGHRMSHEPSALSGGEKQRVAIARALVTKPEVIFADEPTGNLDSKSGQVVMETIQRLNEELGYTVILITHETSTGEHASRIIRIKDGQVESDTPVRNRRRAHEAFIK